MLYYVVIIIKTGPKWDNTDDDNNPKVDDKQKCMMISTLCYFA